jgi:hypothetical protein
MRKLCNNNLELEKVYIDNILQNIPGCVYWKDVNGVYLGG